MCRPAPQKELTCHCGLWNMTVRVPSRTGAPRGRTTGPALHPHPGLGPALQLPDPFQEANSPEPALLSAPRSLWGTWELPLACLLPSRLRGGPAGRDAGKIYQPLSPVKSILSKNLKNASHIQRLETAIPCKKGDDVKHISPSCGRPASGRRGPRRPGSLAGRWLLSSPTSPLGRLAQPRGAQGCLGGRGPRQGSGKTVDKAPGEEVARKREAQDTASETQSRLSLSLHREPWKRGYGAGREQLPGPSSFGKPGLSRQWPRCSGEGRPPIPVCAPTSQQGFHEYEGEGLDTHTCATDGGRTLPCSSEWPLGPWPVPQTGTFSRAHFVIPLMLAPCHLL